MQKVLFFLNKVFKIKNTKNRTEKKVTHIQSQQVTLLKNHSDQQIPVITIRKASQSCPDLMFRGEEKTSQPFLLLSDITFLETELSGLNTLNSKSEAEISTESLNVDHPAILRYFSDDL